MTAAETKPVRPDAQSARNAERRVFGVACGAHALHDGYTDLIYVMLPVWQAEFGLSYAAIGMLRGFFAGAMAAFQIPAGLLAERFGARFILAAGTALAGFGFFLAGASAGFVTLLVALLIGGLGASTQHPLASALVASAFSGTRSLKALGGYNFAGDIGKMTFPAAISLTLIVLPWRPTLALAGAVGVAAAAAIYFMLPHHDSGRFHKSENIAAETAEPSAEAGQKSWFSALLGIGVLDSATRMGFLTFLPFVLEAKGATLPVIGVAFTLVFAGGAAGKLACAFIGARIGTIATVCITEAATAGIILLVLALPLEAAIVALPLLGVALNGTSSVLYGSVPHIVDTDRRARAFGIFYTGTIGAGAAAPVLYGLIGDAIGVDGAVIVLALAVLATIPLALTLKPAFAPADRI